MSPAARPPLSPRDPRTIAGEDHTGAVLENPTLIDAELTRCDLANVRAPGTRATRVVLDDCRLTGIALNEGRLTDILVRGCRADLASFAFCGLERVTFEDCVLTDAAFLEARLYGVRFHRCRLSGADFRAARMTSVELRGCVLDGVVGIESFRGAAMEWPDLVGLAGAFAEALGIDVLEAERA
jgi:uncharacterized protein YjbI with pentapeptide repeats